MASYKIIRKIAAGGMAEVFLAMHSGIEGFEKPVAIKRVLPSMAADRSFIEMFLREAKLTVSLQHANVVQVLDLGTVSNQYFMVMEFVDGENLRVFLRNSVHRGVTLSLREILFIVQQVGEALAYAHDRKDAQGKPLNIIHRDINPSNVMVSRTGEVKLADFGIAKAADFNAGTEVGVVKGKAGYLSPEQVTGLPADQRSDLFLMGLLLYELLNGGKPLFGGGGSNYFQTVKDIEKFDPRALKPLAGVPPPIWAIVMRALARDPAARFQRARDFADAIQHFLFEHRLRVGPQDISGLFAKTFPERRSPLEGDAPQHVQEIRLEPAAVSVPPTPSVTLGTPARMTIKRETTSSGSGRVITRELTPQTVPVRDTPPVRGASGQPATKARMGEMLLARNKLSLTQLELGLKLAKKSGVRLGEVLVAEGIVPEDEVIRVVAEQRRIPFITAKTLREMPLPAQDVLGRMTVDAAEKLRTLPISMAGRELVVAVENPSDLAKLDAIKFATGVSVRPLLIGERALRLGIRRFYYGEQFPPEWEDPQSLVRSATEASKMRFADRATGTREQLFGEEELDLEKNAAKEQELSVVIETDNSNGRSLLLVADELKAVADVAKMLERRGFLVAQSTVDECPDAVRRGVFEFVLLYADAISNPTAITAALRSAGVTDIRLLQSSADALIGEAAVSQRQLRMLSHLLEAACSALGGVAVSATMMAKTAAKVTRQLGGSAAAAERATVGAYAVALSLKLTPRDGQPMPAAGALRSVLGGEGGELNDLISSCEDATNLSGAEDDAVLAVWAAASLVHKVGGASLAPDRVSAVLTQMREEKRLPARVCEALASVMAENLLANGAGATVALFSTDSGANAAIQTRLLADGMGVRVQSRPTTTAELLSQGVSAIVLSHGVPGLNLVEFTRELRSEKGGTLPLFLVVPPEKSELVEAGLDAGADDVLTAPLNPDLLAAKLRRTLARSR